MPGKVDGDHSEVAGETREDSIPGVPPVAHSVQENNGGARACDRPTETHFGLGSFPVLGAQSEAGGSNVAGPGSHPFAIRF